MVCDTPGASSSVIGVTPRKLPPTVTCAPDGDRAHRELRVGGAELDRPDVCGTPALTTRLGVQARSPGRRHLHAADARVHLDLAGRDAGGFAVDFDLRAGGHRADADHAEVRLQRHLEFLLLAAPRDVHALDVVQVARPP
jgi:hypothetical protein